MKLISLFIFFFLISSSLILNYSRIGFALVDSLSTQVRNESHDLLAGRFASVFLGFRPVVDQYTQAKESLSHVRRRMASTRSFLACVRVYTRRIKGLIYMLKRFHRQLVFTHLCLAE